MPDATPSDIDLLARARQGDSSAAAELYVRHAAAARRLASTYRRAGDPDDLVNEAFSRVLGAIDRGAGPEEAFRAYLFVTLRRIAAEQAARYKDEPIAEVPDPVQAARVQGPAFDPADRQIVLHAYQSLPDRWQSVLWHTAVEGRPPRDVAPILGVSANAVAALASRAREKLREAYLQAHLQIEPPTECAPHRSRLGAYVRDGLSPRDKAATEAHLDGCGSCHGLVAELADVNQLLVRALQPLFLSASEAAAVAAGGAAAGGALAGGLAAGRRIFTKARSNPTVAGTIAAAAVVAAALAAIGIGSDSPVPEQAAPAEQVEPPPESPATEPVSSPPPEAPAPSPDPPPADPAAAPPPADAPPAATPAPPPSRPAPPPPTTGTPAPGPPPSAPPPTSPPPPPPAPEPEMGAVVWLAGSDQLQVTLANDASAPTDHIALGVSVAGGALIDGWPSGCTLALPLLISAGCGVSPLDPGEAAIVHVPVRVTGPGQTASVSLCEVAILTVDCDSGLLETTTTDLTG
jgi:RNA polymerase sigma factor (sigma-70 family)